MKNQIYSKELKLGLPHTTGCGFAEHLLFMYAGHYQWQVISEKFGTDLSTLRTRSGDEIYATFFYVGLEFPENYRHESFKLDDELRFFYDISCFKNLIVDGRMFFLHKSKLPELPDGMTSEKFREMRAAYPNMRMSNIFITPKNGVERLKIAPPAGVAFDDFSPMDPMDPILSISRETEKNMKLDLFDDAGAWSPMDGGSYEIDYKINPERDTNGAGLVYFANYIAFLDMAGCAALDALSLKAEDRHAYTLKRKIVYMGNINTKDSIKIKAVLFKNSNSNGVIGLRYFIYRSSDSKCVAVSEAVKSL